MLPSSLSVYACDFAHCSVWPRKGSPRLPAFCQLGVPMSGTADLRSCCCVAEAFTAACSWTLHAKRDVQCLQKANARHFATECSCSTIFADNKGVLLSTCFSRRSCRMSVSTLVAPPLPGHSAHLPAFSLVMLFMDTWRVAAASCRAGGVFYRVPCASGSGYRWSCTCLTVSPHGVELAVMYVDVVKWHALRGLICRKQPGTALLVDLLGCMSSASQS